MDFNYWKKNFAFPHKVNYKILSFLSNERNRKYFHMDEMTNKPWASPRSWTRFSEILNPLEEALHNNIQYQDLAYYAESHVGAEAASEFTAYYKLYLETEMDKIFDDKKKIEIPNDMTGQYIFALSAVGEFFNRYKDPDKKKVEKVWQSFCSIVIEIAKKNISIATVAAKELVDSADIHTYTKFKNNLKNIDPVITEKISNEITLI